MSVNEIIDDYAYVLVRLAAAKDRMISFNKFLDLINSKNIEEFKTKLVTIEKDLPAEVIRNSKDLEASCRDIFFNYVHMLIHNAPRLCQVFILYYIQKYEVENLKTVIVGKVANINDTAVKERINFQIENIMHTEKLINDALHAAKFEDILYIYKSTQYYPVLREIMNRYNSTNEVFFIYALLDRYYIRNFNRLLVDGFHWTKQQKDVIRFYIGTLSDYYNLSMVFRGMNYEFEWSEVELILTLSSETYKIKLDDIKQIHENRNSPAKIGDLIKKFVKRYPNGADLVTIIDPTHIINSLKMFFFNIQTRYLKSKKFASGYELGKVILFLIQKEAEIDTLVTIFEGIKTDYDRESIKQYLITEVAMK
jgi:vacuolar-type H+-ATPase subunit C/Vma6